MQKTQENTAAARAEIQDPVTGFKMLQRLFDQDLRILIGDQDRGIHPEIKTHKLLMTQDIGKGLPFCPPSYIGPVNGFLLFADRPVGMGQEGLQIRMTGRFQKEPGIQFCIRKK